ncbi:P-loop containing nucleoside triphosphate hydrolase protein [Pseudovirgaria hyperparasitica]|uniref:Signal recognition particle receptor subunit alpha homolog n=1 Tax=Pseudovirgaria hyperparasitica TaxID=470096 RepID=A0A6A6WJZ7_9PEZI|nr:P-loop containing nucleoside triphosphate hydrolase protein [Pseudovirgaria hyperparasitica]KAF2762427.1 P-loop containing nucleoside triphosphate hydrolase protein [Pseudovirgaria hyperparasitica]
MLDSFEIVSTSGVVLWSKQYVPVGANIVNSLIRDIFIEDIRTSGDPGQKPTYKKEGYTLKWTVAKDLGLIFVAVYQSLVHMTWIDKLLDNVRTLFTGLYSEQLKSKKYSSTEYPFDDYFDRQVQELESKNDGQPATPARRIPTTDTTPPSSSEGESAPAKPSVQGLKVPNRSIHADSSADATPVPTPDASRPASPAAHILQAKGLRPGGKLSRRDRQRAKTASPAPSSGDEGRPTSKGGKKSNTKKNRVWDEFGLADHADDNTQLDYSAPADLDEATSQAVEHVEESTWGKRTGKGEFVLKDLEDEMDEILSKVSAGKESSSNSTNGFVGSSLGAIGGLFRNVVGGKTLTEADLEKPLKGMEDHLLKKNVAREAAVRLCESVKVDLIGAKTNSFTTIETTLRSAMERALTKILTPTTSLDLLRSIQATNRTGRPYILSIVGVNGVGKSTNLSKIAFFLLQNNFRILVVAADTFRSGAVEQLGVHVRNLQELSAREGGHIDLFQRGYGKDAANIAREAVQHATSADPKYDVVLIDTAGRRHNDTRLMSSLEKFGQLAKPDKIFMVGEALVGSDSVAQARNFNASFGSGRGLDGFIISKCDTVGDMVGTLVSMVHATGIPVVFLGTGQHYADLRTLNVSWATTLLMK